MSTQTSLKTFVTLPFQRALLLGALSFVVACSPKRAAVSVNDNLKETTTAEKKEKSKSTAETPVPGNKETRTASTPRSSGGTGGNAQNPQGVDPSPTPDHTDSGLAPPPPSPTPSPVPNDAPVWSAVSTQLAVEGSLATLNLAPFASDPNGDSLTFSCVACAAGVAVSPTGSLTWTPAVEQAGLQSLTVGVSDGKGGSTTKVVSFDVSFAAPFSAWSHRRKVSINNSAGTETLAHFPLLVKLTRSNFDYAESASGGADVRFATSDGVTEIPFEIDEWVNNGTSLVWVKVPTLAAAAQTHLFIYYGNSNAVAPSALTQQSTWSAYKAVWHFGGENANGSFGVSEEYPDSSGNILVPNTAYLTGAATGSPLGKAPDFPEPDNAFIGFGQEVDTVQGAMFASTTMWLKPKTTAGARIVFQLRVNGSNSCRFSLYLDNMKPQSCHRAPDEDNHSSRTDENNPLVADTWTHVGMVMNLATGTV